ncbi:MAG: hypothetical protein JNK52_13530 [Zoogloeaceae bacterium]|nr:hypothetical protein [Zoogloeaceae bacterium]
MDIEDLKDALGDEKFAALKSYVEDLNGKLRTVRKKADDETAKARDLAGAQARLLEKLGLEALDDIDSLPDAKGQAEAARQFEARMKKLEKALADTTAERDQVAGKFRSAQQKAALAEALAGHDFVDKEVIEAYIGQRVVWEGDELLFKGGGDQLIQLKDGVAGLVKEKPSLLKSAGARGAGFKPGAGSGGIKNPWAKDSFNYTEQIALMRENPQLADHLKSAAAS